MMPIIPSRITEAREARALSMIELADNIGVTRQSISKYERGIIGPSMDMLQAIANTLSYPIDFFYKENIQSVAKGSALFFRSNANVAKKIKTACKYQVKWTDEIKRQLEFYVDFLEQMLPVVDKDYETILSEEIEELALQIRKDWELGEGPLKDIVGILENKGVIFSQIYSRKSCSFKGIDAFSSWKNGTPYILFNLVQKSAVRTRFSICHELGHLILHSSIPEEDSSKKAIVDFADEQADRFAAAFLLPATSFPKDIHGSSLSMLEPIKRKWGVSFSAIIKRCETLHLLSDNQLNYLKRQMTTKKYWHKEPLDDVMTIDGPEMLRDAIVMLINEKIITKDNFVNTSGLTTDDLRVLCALPDDFFAEFNTRQKPILKVYKSQDDRKLGSI